MVSHNYEMISQTFWLGVHHFGLVSQNFDLQPQIIMSYFEPPKKKNDSVSHFRK